jgi:putative hydrolase of the HAD superfamily
VAAEHGLRNLPVEVLNRQFGQAWRNLRDFRHARPEWAALVDAAFAGLTERPPSQTFFPDVYAAFAEPESWRIYDDVIPALETLRKAGLRLAVISNWDGRLRPLLRRLGLVRYFEAIMVSCEVRVPKPGKAIFRAAARELALTPVTILHVGDSRAMDFVGARAAGLQAAWLDRSGTGRAKRGRIRSLAELASVRPTDIQD